MTPGIARIQDPERGFCRTSTMGSPLLWVDHCRPGVLECNVHLLAELLALPASVVVALDVMDVAERQGIHVRSQLP
jgi:hypothetical protein